MRVQIWICMQLVYANRQPRARQLLHVQFRVEQHSQTAVASDRSQIRYVYAASASSPNHSVFVRDNGSLTSRGMPLMSGLQHLGGKQTRAAAQRGCERRCVTRVRRWRSWAGGEICENLSRNCMPVGEFLSSKTMLTKILLTYTTKLNVAFLGLMRLTN